jgi:cytochrome oxidase Cu insertion factor (SCO1/SenC/PrrC family)
MHPEVTSKSAGRKCPKCGMKLTKRDTSTAAATTPTEPTSATQPITAATDEEARPIPNTSVLDQDGRRLDFYNDLVKGRTVAVNFMFTTCTGVCPMLTAKFRQLQQQLTARGSDARLISISVDPTTDTPERMKAYAAQFKAGPGWTFVTGDKPEIDALLRALGSAATNKTDHTSTALVINDAAGFRTRVSVLSPANTLANLVVEAAAKTAKAKPADTAAATGARTTTASDERAKMASASAKYFPNHTLITQDDKQVRFYDDLLKGKVVLINFMFTECNGVCSPMTANLAKVQTYLGERVGREVSMLSITVDPLTDTPAVLKAFAAKHKAGPGWYFLTGKKENIDWVLYKLGGYTDDRQQHSSVLIIGNEATGEWLKVSAMSSPSEIAAQVIKLIGAEGERQSR